MMFTPALASSASALMPFIQFRYLGLETGPTCGHFPNRRCFPFPIVVGNCYIKKCVSDKGENVCLITFFSARRPSKLLPTAAIGYRLQSVEVENIFTRFFDGITTDWSLCCWSGEKVVNNYHLIWCDKHLDSLFRNRSGKVMSLF